jgi:hypothetical protein
MKKLVVVYEIDFELLEIENKKDEKYLGEFPSQKAFIDWLYENENVKVSRANISQAINDGKKKKGYIVLGKYLIFENI